LVAYAGIAPQRQHAKRPSRERERESRRTDAANEGGLAGQRSRSGGEHEAGREPGENEIDEGERVRPFLDETQAGVDHGRAEPEQGGDHERRDGQANAIPRRWRFEAEGGPPEHNEADEGG